MDGGIRGRVEALRREIAEIEKRNLAYFQMPRPGSTAMGDYEKARTEIEGNHG
jgi:hypothetical protein